jgi:hypothetical protein
MPDAQQRKQAAQQQTDAEQQQPPAEAQTEAPATQPEAQQEAQARQEMGAQHDRWQAFDVQQLEGMENIGQVSEVVISEDGQVRAIIVGVGGFLGIGEHEVALDMNQVNFASDPQDPSQVYLIANMTAEQLENAPEFDRTALEQDRQARSRMTSRRQLRRTSGSRRRAIPRRPRRRRKISGVRSAILSRARCRA